MKTEIIYNFRIKVEGVYYIPQFNHEEHGWVEIATTDIVGAEDKLYFKNIFLDINGDNKKIKLVKKYISIQLMDAYKSKNKLDYIKEEYIYID